MLLLRKRILTYTGVLTRQDNAPCKPLLCNASNPLKRVDVNQTPNQPQKSVERTSTLHRDEKIST